jgi:hypothetical protein
LHDGLQQVCNRVEEIMTNRALFTRFETGDFVEHRAAPGVVWEIVVLDLYMSGGPRAKLKHVGGDRLTYEQTCRVLNVFEPSASICWVRDLVEANAMLTLAAVVQHR